MYGEINFCNVILLLDESKLAAIYLIWELF